MGCEVVSVYNDQVTGKIGLPAFALTDLQTRDHHSNTTIFKSKKKPKQIYGFTRSIASSKISSTQILDKQWLIYSSSRYIIMIQPNTMNQRIIVNSQVIISIHVRDKHCLVGLYNKTVLLWDLQFQKIKIQIFLPETCRQVSTVGFTSKYIFVTDSSQPNNIILCYDIKTIQLLSALPVASFQPMIRSQNCNQNLHVTVCADGLWFYKYSNEQKLQVVKGMFGKFPKTSMTSLGASQQIVITGGIDGYLYFWKTKTFKCCKALKAADCQITSVSIKGKYVIIGCIDGRVKVFTFEIMQEKKKINQYIDEPEEQEKQQQNIAFISIDSYLKQGTLITTCFSCKQSQVYYNQTRQGLLFNKNLPMPSLKKINIKQQNQENMMKFNGSGQVIIFESKIYSTYVLSAKYIAVDVYQMKNNKIQLLQQKIFKYKKPIDKFVTYLPDRDQITFVTEEKKLRVGKMLTRIRQAVGEAQSQIQFTCQKVLKLANDSFQYINYIIKDKLLCVLTRQCSYIFSCGPNLKYQQLIFTKNSQNIPIQIELQDKNKVYYDKMTRKWHNIKQRQNIISKQLYQQYSKYHECQHHSWSKQWLNLSLSCGFNQFIIW